ncbi:hypothetical protein [Micromonospora wenchangensis]|uniref:Uncharacterized protein n=1 Tax=Micromonospora wenchangensis TaxID=1185415 RepID=A0A246RK82_9ACTN|nr:hypothetical protein [Micromonospora wenchangensis]OWV04564.1 hypothetical protein B5D80_19915 [Micromonospora wenchangensis]
MTSEPRLLDRPHLPSSPPPLDWLTLADAFEVACLVRCTPTPTARPHTPTPPQRGTVEFNREDAALRMRQLLARLDVPVEHEVVTGGLRRRYELHRLHVPADHRAGFTRLRETGWRQGRRELLGPAVGSSTPRAAWRTRLASAAWRSALLAGGRHVRRHILGIRLADRELAAVLIRSAALLEVPALLHPGAGCLVVSVADGPDRLRIMERAALAPARTTTLV